jgi:metal-responsive CopG/Arc/MetJ family transcriptional regulator
MKSLKHDGHNKRIMISLNSETLKKLDQISKILNVSRSVIINKAIICHLERDYELQRF